ncbi:hypothetical protein ACJX0J_039144 [Zea mays]
MSICELAVLLDGTHTTHLKNSWTPTRQALADLIIAAKRDEPAPVQDLFLLRDDRYSYQCQGIFGTLNSWKSKKLSDFIIWNPQVYMAKQHIGLYQNNLFDKYILLQIPIVE